MSQGSLESSFGWGQNGSEGGSKHGPYRREAPPPNRDAPKSSFVGSTSDNCSLHETKPHCTKLTATGHSDAKKGR